MKKYNLSETLKAKFAALLEDIDALARTLGKKPEDITDRDLAAIAKMKPRERPNFFLDGDELEQIAQNTKDAGLDPLVTQQGAMDDEDPYDTVKSYEPTVNMRKDKDATKTLKYDLEDTDIDGDPTDVDTEYDRTSVVAEEIAAALIRKITKGRTDMSLEELKAALKEELEQEA
tara:strand:- start:500 stop:1021 length:522 start_codon:yes stop_codon:yes gene_type:complete